MVWYVAQIQSRHWALGAAIATLHRNGREVFVPWRAPDRPVRRRVVISKLPLFPGYVFVAPGFDENGKERDWRGINYTRGVLRLLPKVGNNIPVEAPADLVDMLKTRMHADGGLIRLERAFKVGDRVAILRGPLAASVHEEPRTGLFQADDGERVKLLLDILGTPQVVSIPRTHLSVA